MKCALTNAGKDELTIGPLFTNSDVASHIDTRGDNNASISTRKQQTHTYGLHLLRNQPCTLNCILSKDFQAIDPYLIAKNPDRWSGTMATARSQSPSGFPDPTAINLGRLLSRLERTVLVDPSPQLRKSPYERARVSAVSRCLLYSGAAN